VLNVPIVASDVGGASQVLAGSANSQLVEPGDNSGLAQAVRDVLRTSGLSPKYFLTARPN